MYYSPSGLRLHCDKLVIAVRPNMCLTSTLEMRIRLACSVGAVRFWTAHATSDRAREHRLEKLCIVVVIPLEFARLRSGPTARAYLDIDVTSLLAPRAQAYAMILVRVDVGHTMS
ncbi:hypothetical protein A0H81_12027 [Grifola frondosa]|uniref:Uncharacterized protein n=1 Tax=Grifola frondosa TaxID=5627 RepID=A0A1C7LTL4_GRIFR|nr:hypothetical protein A0H81_12027 [Grifola frondosa]